MIDKGTGLLVDYLLSIGMLNCRYQHRMILIMGYYRFCMRGDSIIWFRIQTVIKNPMKQGKKQPPYSVKCQTSLLAESHVCDPAFSKAVHPMVFSIS